MQKNFILICWYWPPTSNSDDASFNALNEVISKLDSEGKEIFLIGDTNCDMKKSKYGPTKKLKASNNEFQLQQIKNYTRIASKANDKGVKEMTKSLIDHIAINRPNYISEAGTVETSFDYYLVYARRKINCRFRVNKKVKFVETRRLLQYGKNFS